MQEAKGRICQAWSQIIQSNSRGSVGFARIGHALSGLSAALHVKDDEPRAPGNDEIMQIKEKCHASRGSTKGIRILLQFRTAQ